MHALLYENQPLLDSRHLVGYARELGLDTKRFESELESHVHHPRVREDFLSGVRSGVNGTPAFFINGARYDGSWDAVPLVTALQSTVAKVGSQREASGHAA